MKSYYHAQHLSIISFVPSLIRLVVSSSRGAPAPPAFSTSSTSTAAAFQILKQQRRQRPRQRRMVGEAPALRSLSSSFTTSASSNSDIENSDIDIENFFSLTHLQVRIAKLIGRAKSSSESSSPASSSSSQRTTTSTINDNNNKLNVVIAGGGSTFLSTLAATPGASTFLLEGTVAYSRASFDAYCSQAEGPPSASDLAKSEAKTKSYCSALAAQQLADAAWNRAAHLLSMEPPEESSSVSTTDWASVLTTPTGLAVTSVLQSVDTRRSVQTKGSRAYCCAQTSIAGTRVELSAHLSSSSSSSSSSSLSSNKHHQRTRFDEDVLVAHCLVTCWEMACSLPSKESVRTIPGVTTALTTTTTNRCEKSSTTTTTTIVQGTTAMGDELRMTITSIHPSVSPEHVLRIAAERILSGQDAAVLLLPSSSNQQRSDGDTSDDKGVMTPPPPPTSFRALHRTARLPPKSLIVPGSFHPPHRGHWELAWAAAAATQCRAVFFELSMTNADKPPLSADAVAERLPHFLTVAAASVSSSSPRNSTDHPDGRTWGLLLTDAPLFRQKVELLAPLQMIHNDNNNEDEVLHFCIGTDTLVRLIDPKYYGDSRDEMLRALADMPCRFVVGGRLEQQKPKPTMTTTTQMTREEEPVFVTGREHIRELPKALQKKFILLSDFRVDISSTELRRQMTESASADVGAQHGEKNQ